MGVFNNIIGIINHLGDEFIELRENTEKSPSRIPNEAADCFILLLQLAHSLDFDLLEEAKKKMETNRKRKWGKPDMYGIIEHIKGKKRDDLLGS